MLRERKKGKTMNINAIGVTTFGNKVQLAKKAAMAVGAGSLLAATPAVDTFVKGISKPEQAVEEDIISSSCQMDSNHPGFRHHLL